MGPKPSKVAGLQVTTCSQFLGVHRGLRKPASQGHPMKLMITVM
jgi:hypothetical protein